jgi:hypothetical protein
VANLNPPGLIGSPSIDFCVTAQGGTPQGPVMEKNGVSAGIAPGEVSARFPFTPGVAHTITILRSDAATCLQAGSTSVTIPAQFLTANVKMTVARMPGNTSGTGGLNKYYTDEGPITGKANVRFIHASIGVLSKVSVKVEPTNNSVVTMFGGVTYSLFAPQGGGVDGNGYRQVDAISAKPILLTRDEDGVTLLRGEGSLAANKAYSIFSWGEYNKGAGTLKFVACDDEAAPVNQKSACLPGGVEQIEP